MELHWPLILFTTLGAASAGVFAIQGIYALAGKGKKAQLPALIVSVVLLVASGIAVFFHLEHWERIFNGFGHITSGITQELIAIVAIAVVMVVYFASLRRSEDGGTVPKWCAILAVVVAVALVVVMGMSYMMSARPAWNNVFQVLSLLGYALAVGVAIFAAIDAKAESDSSFHGPLLLVGAIAQAICGIGFIFTMSNTVGSFISLGNYYDPNHPTAGMVSASDYSPFAEDTVVFTVCAIVLVIVAIAFAIFGKLSKKWMVAGIGAAACAMIGAACLRAVFFACGGSVFMFY